MNFTCFYFVLISIFSRGVAFCLLQKKVPLLSTTSTSIIRAVKATLCVAMCNISWLISADRSVPDRAGRVTLALLACL